MSMISLFAAHALRVASALSTPLPVEFHASQEDGVSATVGDVIGVKPGILTQFRVEGTGNSPDALRGGFQLRMIRPTLRMWMVKPWVRLFVQPELAGEPRLLDAELDIQPYDAVGLKIGQFLTPAGRASFTPVPALAFPDNSPTNTMFRGDRDAGAMLHGSFLGGGLEYFAGVFNGTGLAKVPAAPVLIRPQWMGRVAVNPLGKVGYTETPNINPDTPLGISLGMFSYLNTHSELDPNAGGALLKVAPHPGLTAGADATLHWRTVMLYAEAGWRWNSPAFGSVLDVGNLGRQEETERAWNHLLKGYASMGGTLQASWFLVPRYVELALRQSVTVGDITLPQKTRSTTEIQTGLYVLGNRLKVLATYALTTQPSPVGWTPPGQAAGVQVQMWL